MAWMALAALSMAVFSFESSSLLYLATSFESELLLMLPLSEP
jgi:hypothetical protein